MLFFSQRERSEGGNGRAQGEDAELHEEVPRHQGRQTPGQYQPQVGSLFTYFNISFCSSISFDCFVTFDCLSKKVKHFAVILINIFD